MRGINDRMIPPRGILLAYFPHTLVFSPYTAGEDGLRFEGWQRYLEETPKQCHLFDADTEYRMVMREARNDRVEIVLTKEEENKMDPDLLYVEDVLVREEYRAKETLPKRLRIVNRYRYTENDTLTLKNYRIALLEEDLS